MWGEVERNRLEREGGARMWAEETLLLFVRHSYDLLFLEMELAVLEVNEYLVSFLPGVDSGGRKEMLGVVLGVGEKYLKRCPFCLVRN